MFSFSNNMCPLYLPGMYVFVSVCINDVRGTYACLAPCSEAARILLYILSPRSVPIDYGISCTGYIHLIFFFRKLTCIRNSAVVSDRNIFLSFRTRRLHSRKADTVPTKTTVQTGKLKICHVPISVPPRPLFPRYPLFVLPLACLICANMMLAGHLLCSGRNMFL